MTLCPLRQLLAVLAALCALGALAALPGPTPNAAPPREAPATLTSRPRPAPAAEKALAVGSEITTGIGERRRLRLPDGSALYVNQKTTVRLTGRSQLTLAAGEVFLDVAPRKKGEALSVKTAKREVSSAGTKFAVRADDKGTSVLVASGRVKVRGVEAPVRAGQQLSATGETPTAAPRVSHALAWLRDLLPGASLVPASPHAGGALVARDPNGQEAKLALRRYHVDVHVEDGFARTTIDQTYFNASSERLEGTFYFPLPPDASLSRLAMYVDGRRMEGGMAERDYARSVYETIRYTQRDPALLEWVDGSTFKMRVFPLEARQEKRILLSYTQKLPGLYGQQSYRLPAGHSLGKVANWSFHARVKGGAALGYGSPSHAFKVTKNGGDLLLDASAKNTALDRDVVLDLGASEARADDEAVRFSSMAQDGAKYLMVRYRPGLAAEPVRQRRDWVFLVETSGDRDPLLARTQVEVVRALLQNAEPDDTFALLTANTRTRALHDGAQPVTPSAIESASRFLEQAHLIGALDLGRALGDAKPYLEAGRAPYLVHVGSGVPSMGERRHDVLAAKLPKGARYVGIGVGRRWNRALMKVAAERTAGLFAQINPDEPVAWRGFDLAATLNTPRLLDVSVADKAGKATFLPFVNAVAQGEEVTALARVEGDLPKAVVVRGKLDGKEIAREVEVRDVKGKAGYLPRAWARLEIERLLAGDVAANKEKVIALSKAMYVMTPFTSLLVLESEEMYVQFKVDRGRKDHWATYPAPERIEVVYEPEDGEEPKGKGKPSAKQVVGTVLVRGRPSVLGEGRSTEEWRALRRARTGDLMRRGAIARRLSESAPLGTDWGNEPSSRLGLGRKPSDVLPEALFRDGGEQAVPRLEAATRQLVRLRASPMLPPEKAAPPDPLELNYFVDRIEEVSVAGRLAQTGGGVAGRDRDLTNTDLGLDDRVALAFSPDGRNLASAGLDHLSQKMAPAPRAFFKRSTIEAFDFQAEAARPPLLHGRPGFSNDHRLFTDLMRFAPGLNTTFADARAVLEAEARPTPASKPGSIDAGARAHFAKARPAGWRSLTIPAGDDQPAITIAFDATGRYAYSRTLPRGLRERVVCDGTTLWHAYPDLGLASRRAVSRFHRLAFTSLVPQALPAPDDLARGADLRLVAPDTVALVSHGAGKEKGADGKPVRYHQLQFVFADGRLAERQVVEMPARKVLLRETYSAEGEVKRFGADGKELASVKCVLKVGEAPSLKPDLRGLVVLTLPFRTRAHLVKTLKIEKVPNDRLRFDDARALLAADVAAGNGAQALATFKQALHSREQKEIGYYVLMATGGVNLDGDNGDVLGEHPEEALAHYLALHTSPVLRKHAAQWAAGSNAWPEGFLKRLATAHALAQRWGAEGRALAINPATRPAERERALAFVRRHKEDPLSWGILGLVQARVGEAERHKADVRPAYKALAEAWKLFEGDPGLGTAARYEQARCLFKAGEGSAARKLFRALHAEALKEGGLLRIDADFVEALRGAGRDEVGWSALMRRTATGLVKQKKRGAVLTLAYQSWEVGDQALAQQLHAQALADLPEGKERLPLRLAGLQFLTGTAQFAEADRDLQKLLAEPATAKRAALWRLGAQLAERRGQPARRLECLEKALELEQQSLPEVLDLQSVRTDYQALLDQYARLADALVTLKLPAPAGFRDKVVRAADRWRMLDPHAAEKPCQLAGAILTTLGERELAWDYLTTPAALKPNEPAPWAGLAEELKRQGDLPLADRAYRTAFEAEPTNADLLWERARNLRQVGKAAEAREVYRRLAEGDWQPRFRGVKEQARAALEG